MRVYWREPISRPMPFRTRQCKSQCRICQNPRMNQESTPETESTLDLMSEPVSCVCFRLQPRRLFTPCDFFLVSSDCLRSTSTLHRAPTCDRLVVCLVALLKHCSSASWSQKEGLYSWEREVRESPGLMDQERQKGCTISLLL